MATTTEDSLAVERGYRSLSSLFRPLPDTSNDCHRCSKKVYQQEKVGPVHDVVFHKNCFRCLVCGQFLNIRNYWSNPTDSQDKEVYCNSHAPRIGAPKLGPGAMGIKSAVDAQKGYQKMSKKLKPEVREAGTLRIPSYGMQAIEVQRAVSVPKSQKVVSPDPAGPQFGKDALHIKGPLDAQLLMKGYQKSHDRHHYPPNIYKKRKVLLDAQKRLEEEHRREEDQLLQEITQNRRQEIRRLSDELNMEWQVKLKELTEKFEREMDKKKKKIKDSEKKQMTIHFENQRKDLEIVINEKKNKKRESMTMRMREKEQRVTSTMVARQSKQMLDLLAAKKEEIKQEIQQEIIQETNGVNGKDEQEEIVEEVIEALGLPSADLPPPHPPSCRKTDLYDDVSIFSDLDDQVIKVAENEQVTYTELVQQLTENLKTDLEKVRALYRWVTVKDLNVIDFEQALGNDNPMGLLRGIKFGTETYHVLFMRLCSYAGMHCVEIKGHSKSVGYEPGMKIQPESFQNTWNAVLVDGDWRLIQCNWGARHLVLNKDKKKEKSKPKSSKDQIRYQYDEHYFLTDPDEFIQEFWSKEPEWQLLENPITLEEFEALPFVRSVFFHFGMRFDHGMTAVLNASAKGGYDIKLKIPESMENDLVFYYQLRFADKERRMEATYRGSSLERFVFQTMIHNTVMFSIHLPTTGEFFFEIFANKIEESNKFGNSEDTGTGISPFRLKCACKFKILCPELSGKMHPLPDCASGEWGPIKGKRHFGIQMKQLKHLGKSVPESNTNEVSTDKLSDSGSSESGLGDAPDNPKAGIINVDDGIELYAKISRPLHFVAKLKANIYDSKSLDPFVHSSVEGDNLTVRVCPPQTGQYGLDVYARPKEASDSTTLSHAFKFLINCIKVTNPVDIPRAQPKQLSKKEKWGATPQFEELGLKILSHKEPKISCTDSNQCTIDIFVPSKVTMSHQFLKEPDEEKSELVSMVKDEADSQKVKIFVNVPLPGNYMLSLFARKKDVEDLTMPNVYNFLITYKKSSKESNGSAKTEERRPSSIFRKSLFKKSEKDKSKDKDK